MAETKDTTAASGEESQAASDAAEKETAADTQQTDLEGAEVTFWYMPLYEGFDEKMSRDLAQEVKDKYGIILNTEVLTWDAGPEGYGCHGYRSHAGSVSGYVFQNCACNRRRVGSRYLSATAEELGPLLYDGVLDTGS